MLGAKTIGGKKMKIMRLLLFLLSVTLLGSCQTNEGQKTMVLLEEEVVEIIISESNGVGNINLEPLMSFDDNRSIKLFENAIRTAVKSNVSVSRIPDYDIIVSYGDEFPKHAIHLWLEKEGEQSTLSYMVGEGETYTTSAKATNQLRELIILE